MSLFLKFWPFNRSWSTVLVLALAGACHLCSAEVSPNALKTETFDYDPGWEGYNNHIAPTSGAVVTQDFGYQHSHHASKTTGEIGGTVQRASEPAYYAAALTPKSLEVKFSASGVFAITATTSSAGVFFGFFNSAQHEASGRPIGSLGMDFDFEKKGGRLAVRLRTSGNQSCGTFITPFIPGRYRPTPLMGDGTRYHWTLDYDPSAAKGHGAFTFTIATDRKDKPALDPNLPKDAKEEALARFPYTDKWTVELPEALRKEGATFDRFGLLNGTKAGHAATLFFGDLHLNGNVVDLSRDPGWVRAG